MRPFDLILYFYFYLNIFITQLITSYILGGEDLFKAPYACKNMCNVYLATALWVRIWIFMILCEAVLAWRFPEVVCYHGS